MADNFLAYFGVRYVFPPDADVETLEDRSDWRMQAARRAKLKAWWGRLTAGEYYFLLVGTELGRLGVEDETAKTVQADELLRAMQDTRERLKAAGFEGEPALHLQLEAEY